MRGSRSIVPAALPSRNLGPGECGTVAQSSGLWPRFSVRGVCVCGVRLAWVPCPPLPLLSLSPPSHLQSADPTPSPCSPHCPPPWALQLRMKLPVPRHLCVPIAVGLPCPRGRSWGGCCEVGGGQAGRPGVRSCRRWRRAFRDLKGQFNEIM